MLARWDRAVVEAFQDAHWHPADVVFLHLSDWWVKSLVIVGLGLAADLWSRRLPVAAALSTVAYFAAGGIADVLKDVFDRPRPSLVDPAVHPLVAVPDSYAMPSGHAATAFGAAVAVALLHRRLGAAVLGLAALVALSRGALPLGRTGRCGARVSGFADALDLRSGNNRGTDVIALTSLLPELPTERTRLLDNLGRVRREVGPITPELADALADHMNIRRGEVHEVTSFYS